MPPPPAEAVTFLFTHIAGTISLWDGHPEGFRLAVISHDELLRRCIEDHGGLVFQVDGSAFRAAFPMATQALGAALAAQPALTAEALGLPSPLPVRMALHTGTAEQRGGDYSGPPVDFAARLLAAGHGGQVLLSGVTQELVRGGLPPPAALRDIGRLKGRGRPERVFQVLHPTLAVVFPPLRPPDIPVLPHNLPQQPTSDGRGRRALPSAGNDPAVRGGASGRER